MPTGSRARTEALDAFIGYHLEQAYRYRVELRNTGAETDAIARRASERLEVAAAAALERSDLSAASGLLQRAASLPPVPDEGRSRLLTDLAATLMDAGELIQAEHALPKRRRSPLLRATPHGHGGRSSASSSSFTTPHPEQPTVSAQSRAGDPLLAPRTTPTASAAHGSSRPSRLVARPLAAAADAWAGRGARPAGPTSRTAAARSFVVDRVLDLCRRLAVDGRDQSLRRRSRTR